MKRRPDRIERDEPIEKRDVLGDREPRGQRLKEVMMGIDQPRNDDAPTRIDDAVGLARQVRCGRTERFDRAVAHEDRRVLERPFGVVERLDVRRVANQQRTHARSGFDDDDCDTSIRPGRCVRRGNRLRVRGLAVDRASRRRERRPFADRAALHARMDAIVAESRSKTAQVALIRAHPDLAGRVAREGRLTAASAAEQAACGPRSR